MLKTYKGPFGTIEYQAFTVAESMRYKARYGKVHDAYKEGGTSAILDTLADIVENLLKEGRIKSVDLEIGEDKVTSLEDLNYHDQGSEVLLQFAVFLTGAQVKTEEKKS